MATKIISVDSEIEKATNVIIDESQIEKRVKIIIDKAGNLTNATISHLLMQAVSHIDLTSLKGNETREEIEELCKKAVEGLSFSCKTINTAAVCVYPASACDAINALKDLKATDIVNVASVAADFPRATLPLEERIAEIKKVVGFGVDEVDIVINRKLALDKKWNELYDELKLMKDACGTSKLKTILATGDLPSLKDVYIVSVIAMLAGSNFIKTSTGKEIINATLPVGVVMCKAIKDYELLTGQKVGLKPAGGIKTAQDVLQWITLVSEELGNNWLSKDLFRIGASSALDNIIETVETLEQCII